MKNNKLGCIKPKLDKNFPRETESKNLCILIHGYGEPSPWKDSHNKLKDIKKVVEESWYSR